MAVMMQITAIESQFSPDSSSKLSETSSRLISNWKNNNIPVEYFIALEKSSKYGV